MRFSPCKGNLFRSILALTALSASVASLALAEPGKPRKPGSFRLFASAEATLQTNRIACHIGSDGQLCASGSSTVGGGIWPKGTSDQYIFASGLQIAGIIDNTLPKAQNGFAGDTAGAMFYNTALGSGNGLEVRPIFSSTNPADATSWPNEARVPCSPATNVAPLPLPPARCAELGLGGDPTGDLFNPALQGSIAASQGDNWFMSWEGDPSQLSGPRTHPLGILVESRALAWNFPSGNEDILYFMFTFYNVTSSNAAAYANIRSSVRDLVAQKGKDFVALNQAKFGINLPADGYSINDIFVSVVADNDVAQADANFASVNVPFALGYTYAANFRGLTSWSFDPSIFGTAPFFPGSGFIGLKYLRSPVNPATGQEVGLTLFGTFSRSSGSLQDPGDEKQLYRYLSGQLLPTDGACNAPNSQLSHICFVNLGDPADMRQLQSSGPFNLAPGQSGVIVVAYINAPPVAEGNCPGVGCLVVPTDGGVASRLNILGDASRMAGGVNRIDKITGYKSFNDANGDGIVTQAEFVVQPGSLLGKSLVAQTVFDNKFLLPFSPERPDFFLVPGDNQVTVFWTPSATETTPDPFFAIASTPLNADGTVNPLYDPNFRDTDVEGYRIYRGRTSNPSELTLIAQFDYAPDPFNPTATKGRFKDFRATVNPIAECAPEIGVRIACSEAFDSVGPGVPFTVDTVIDLLGTITQIVPGNRVLLANGKAQVLPGKVDTAFADISRGKVAAGVSTDLTNSGVPFVFTDPNVRNSLRYFYAVTAFDVNSAASGPSSLESARLGKAVTPVPTPNNVQSTVSAVTAVLDRNGTPLTNTTVPTLDPATGKFSGPFPPANGATPGLAALMSQVLGSPATFAVKLDSMSLGEAGNSPAACCFGAPSPPVANVYFFTAKPGTPQASAFSVPVVPTTGGVGAGAAAAPNDTTGVGFFGAAAPIDPASSAHFEAGAGFSLSGKLDQKLPSATYLTGQGIGCALGDPGFTPGACSYNGARWFDGPSPTTNETKNDPNAGNSLAETIAATTDFNNAGQLTGVTIINEPHAYTMFAREWRNIEWAMAGAARAADFNVYWGTGGTVDSVIDITHNVVVPFDTIIRGSWGILNTAGTGGGDEFDTRPTVLTQTDVACVEPLRSVLPGPAARIPCSQAGVFTSAPYKLSNQAQLGVIAFGSGAVANLKDPALAPPAGQPGFLFYLAGHQFLMQMAALPAAGTIWALRTYAGAISGGKGVEGDHGAYSFTPAIRPFTAIGAQTQVTISASTVIAAATKGDLANVHTVPDPYYVQSKFEVSTDQKVLKFVGLPQDCIIRIYTASGVLVRVLEHHAGTYSSASTTQGSERDWDLKNRNNQVVASGVYFWHVEAAGARKLGRFTVVNFAQ
jgi:hypothetical protein